MEFNFSLKRLALLAACLVAFFLLGGFSQPEVPQGVLTNRINDAWLKIVLLFVGGAVCVSVIDHVTGTLDPTNLRAAYVVLGVLMMAGSVIWLRAFKDVLKHNSPAALSAPQR